MSTTKSNSTRSIATHPCKKRKDGAPSVGMVLAKTVKGGPPAQVASHDGEFAMTKIFVTVSGGCAYAIEDTVPQGFTVEIIDFDNIEAGDNFPSEEAREYCTKHDLYEAPRALQR